MKKLILCAVFAIGIALMCMPVRAQDSPEMKLWNACRNGDVATAREMLDKGVNPNHKYDVGITPIAAAAMRGQGAPPLIEAGLRGKPTANDLAMAWVLAKRSKKDEIAASLEKAGAKPAPTMTLEMLAKFAGDYRNSESMELQLAVRDGKLIGTGGAGMGSFFEEEMVFHHPGSGIRAHRPFSGLHLRR